MQDWSEAGNVRLPCPKRTAAEGRYFHRRWVWDCQHYFVSQLSLWAPHEHDGLQKQKQILNLKPNKQAVQWEIQIHAQMKGCFINSLQWLTQGSLSSEKKQAFNKQYRSKALLKSKSIHVLLMFNWSVDAIFKLFPQRFIRIPIEDGTWELLNRRRFTSPVATSHLEF